MPKGYKRATEKRHQTGCLSDIKTMSNDRVKNKQGMERFSLHQLIKWYLAFDKEWFKCFKHNLSDDQYM